MRSHTGRRRFLKLAGTGTALSFAGCNALQSDGTNSTAPETGSGPGTSTGEAGSGSGDAERVTLQVQPNRQTLQQRQQEIQSQVQNGDLGPREAQQEIQSAREELRNRAADTFRSRVEGESSLTVEDSLSEYGVFLVSGSSSALIDSLAYESVGSLFDAETFAETRAQLRRRQGTPQEGTGTPTEEGTASSTEEADSADGQTNTTGAAPESTGDG